MSRILAALFVFSLLTAVQRPASAQFMTAKELSDGCMADAKNNISYCLGYIAGVIDYHVMLQSLGTAPTVDFCLPPNVTVQQAAVVVLAYLERAPQNGAFIAAPAVTMAMHESYPCGAPVSKKKKR